MGMATHPSPSVTCSQVLHPSLRVCLLRPEGTFNPPTMPVESFLWQLALEGWQSHLMPQEVHPPLVGGHLLW